MKIFYSLHYLKIRKMQIEKAQINDRLRVSKVSIKFGIPTIYNFVVIYIFTVFSFNKQNRMHQYTKTCFKVK